MQEAIEVSWDIGPTYRSLEEAVQTASSSTRLAEAKRDLERVKGATVERVAASGAAVTLALSNGVDLRVYLEGPQVAWSLSGEPRAEVNYGGPAVEDGTLFEMVCGNGNRHRFRWDGGELLSKRVGRRVTNLFAGPTPNAPFYFYTSKQLILCFYVMTEISTGRRLLFSLEDD